MADQSESALSETARRFPAEREPERWWEGFRVDAFNDWPQQGGLWSCACGWTGATDKIGRWRNEAHGGEDYECPLCGRRDLIQYVEASVAAPKPLLRALSERLREAEKMLNYWHGQHAEQFDRAEAAESQERYHQSG